MTNDDASGTPLRRGKSLPIALALLAISAGLNVLSAHRISVLRAGLNAAESRAVLELGLAVPEIVGLDAAGSPAVLRYSDARVPTVLYVFTPQCGWCKKNIANLHALINQAGSRYRVVGVALTRQDLDSYINGEGLRIPVYSNIRSDIRNVYRLGGTPETIVVSPESKVLRVWQGAYEPQIRAEIEQFLGVDLPGCCA